MLLTKGEFGIQLSTNANQKMLSYLIAVELEKIIDHDLDLRKRNFEIELLMKNMN